MCEDRVKQLYRGLQVRERPEQPMDRRQRLQAMEEPLLDWYGRRARALPWRDDPQPYRVWVSEIMLQQTRVEAVKPYFERFMEALPTVADLAQAPDDLLMKLWEGLGYYSRVRNLKKAAVQIMEEYGGTLPADVKKLQSLPGIGSYTAGAIASIAYDIPAPAVDGNVLRVISRLTQDRTDLRLASTKTGMENALREIMPQTGAGSYNQALIEIGALVCIPVGEPKCGECPLYSLCLTGRKGLWREIPFKSPPRARKTEDRTVFLIETEKKVAVGKRPPKGLLASLYQLPNCEGRISAEEAAGVLGLSPELILEVEPLPPSRHVFSHVEWHMEGYRIRLREEIREPFREDTVLGGCFLAPREEIASRYALPRAFHAYTEQIGGADNEADAVCI